MKIVVNIVDHDQFCALTLFDDDVIAITDEKAYVEIGADGTVLQKTWKETPQGAHFKAILDYDGQSIQAPPRLTNESSSPFEALCFALTRRPEIIAEICK